MTMAPSSAAARALSGVVLLLEQQREQGILRIERALAIDESEALDSLGLPAEDHLDKADNRGVGAELSRLSGVTAKVMESAPSPRLAENAAAAALYELAGDEESAAQAYQRIGRAYSESSSNVVTPAVRAMHQHRYEDAEPLLLRWLAAKPDDDAVRYNLIQVRRKISAAQIIRLLAVAPDSYHVHQLLGQLYVSREEDDQALSEYLAVAAARPDLPEVHFWLGHLYWKHGDADHAIAELTRELQLSPGHPEANAELGTVLVAEERAVEAISHLESAIRSKPDLWPAYSQLGRAYAMEKNYIRAEKVLQPALAHDQDGNTHYQYGLVLRAEGKTAQATKIFAEVRAIKSEKMAAPATDDAANAGAK